MSHTLRRLLGMTGSALVTGVLAMTTTTGAAAGTAWTSAPAHAGGLHSSIVIARPGHLADAAAAVRATGGKLGKPLAIINGFTASVSSAAAARLDNSRSVISVTANDGLKAASTSYDSSVAGATYPASSRATGLWSWDQGSNVTVAVLDTGVTPVADLANRVTRGPDLSGEGDSLKDTYGHGTVMAGIIAGNGALSNGTYQGIAPKAKIVSVKVAGANGATDVSQVLAGLQWIGSFASQYGIKVVSLAYGTNSHASPVLDPLDFAVERLWAMGITVVASAGNAGPGPYTITKPGDDPAIITAGAYDESGTSDPTDDASLSFSSRGPTANGDAKPDLVSPGRSLVAVRSPGSTIEQHNPQALVDNGYIRGSGTSQATAVTAGAVALLVAAHRSWTPDQLKYALTSTSRPMTGVSSAYEGAGEIRVSRAQGADGSAAPVQHLTASGGGSLEASRGDAHVLATCPGDSTPTLITGEMDALCNAWDGESWAGESWTGESWAGESWAGESWAGESWAGESWAGESWAGESWAGESWSGESWDAGPSGR